MYEQFLGHFEKIKYPLSFWLLIATVVVVSSISVIWSFTHLVILAIAIGMMVGMRFLCHWEVKEKE